MCYLHYAKIPISEGQKKTGGVKRGDYLPPHKYIDNLSEYGRIPKEQLLSDRRQTSEKESQSPSNEVGQNVKI